MALSNRMRIDMKKELASFRKCKGYYDLPVLARLKSIPISCSWSLFNINDFNIVPCDYLGRMLVYKIIDELLDL